MTETFLFLDTETTGFKKSGNLIQQGQARVCQVAMILADDTGKTLAEYQSMIKPDNWDTNGHTKNYYGLSYDDCQKYGIHQLYAMQMYKNMCETVTQVVAHNSPFDKGMMEIEEAYCNMGKTDKPWFCTMKTNTHISPNGKWPKLDFTLKHLTGKDLLDAHDAMADTRACRDIFFAMRGIQL